MADMAGFQWLHTLRWRPPQISQYTRGAMACEDLQAPLLHLILQRQQRRRRKVNRSGLLRPDTSPRATAAGGSGQVPAPRQWRHLQASHLVVRQPMIDPKLAEGHLQRHLHRRGPGPPAPRVTTLLILPMFKRGRRLFLGSLDGLTWAVAMHSTGQALQHSPWRSPDHRSSSGA